MKSKEEKTFALGALIAICFIAGVVVGCYMKDLDSKCSMLEKCPYCGEFPTISSGDLNGKTTFSLVHHKENHNIEFNNLDDIDDIVEQWNTFTKSAK